MKVLKVKEATNVTVTVKLSTDECKALIDVLGELTGEMSKRTCDIYDKLDDIFQEECSEKEVVGGLN